MSNNSDNNNNNNQSDIKLSENDFAKTASLMRIVVGETACAALSAAVVAPVIAIVDQSIFSNASGREKMGACIRRQISEMFRKPLTFVRQPSLAWIFAVYGSTYIAANNCETLYVRYTQNSAEIPKFVVTSGANIGMSMLKDRAFASMFAAVGAPKRSVPSTSLALFGIRDCITIGASFTLVPYVAQAAEQQFGWTRQSSDLVAQLATPCAAQFINTPLYLLGLSLYNTPEHTSSQRFSFIGM